MGTTVFEVRNQDNTLLSGAEVTLIGLDEQLDPVRFDATTDAEGCVTFENIPAGSYTLRVAAEDHGTLETAIEVAAVIDRTPRVVTLQRRMFTFVVDETATGELHRSSAATSNYDSVVYKADLLTNSSEPQLVPNFVADEKEFYYQSGKLISKLSFMDPEKAEAAVTEVTVRVEQQDDTIPAGAVAFSSGGTLSPTRNVGTVKPGEVFDIVWSLDLERFFLHAAVSESETEGEYLITFPADATQEMIDAYLAANDPAGTGAMTLLSYDAESNTGVYRTHGTPNDRVPLYYGERPYFFDFTLLASGVRADTGALVETRIPVRVHYVAPDYYVNAGAPESLYDENGNYTGQQHGDIYDVHPEIEQTIRTAPAFEPGSGRVSDMYYSSGFFRSIQADRPTATEGDEDVSIDLGFAGDVGYEGQITTLRMKLKNPSKKDRMEDVKVRLVLTDAPYDSNGELRTGGTVLNPEVNVYVKGGTGSALSERDGWVEGYLGTDDEASVEFSFRLDSFLRSFDLLKQFDETLAQYLVNTQELNKVYARIEGSFVLNGEEHSFTSGVREYEVKEKPKLYVSYDLQDNGGETYVLTATVTNLGEGDAHALSLGVPTLPDVGFNMRIVNVTSTRGRVERGTNAAADCVKIDVLKAGDTAVVSYWLSILGEMSDKQKISLGKLAAMPSLPIKSEMGNGIVMAPMKMEAMRSQSTLEDIDAIIEELGILSGNLHVLTDKTASELGRSLANFYDYSVSLSTAVEVGLCYDMLSNLAKIVAGVKGALELPKTIGDKIKELKGLPTDDAKAVNTLQNFDKWYDESYEFVEKSVWDQLDWVQKYVPDDPIFGWKDKIDQTVSEAKALASKGSMNKLYSDYFSLIQQAAEVLAEATTAMQTAMKTTDAAERAAQTKTARVRMEQAALLIARANEAKAGAADLLEVVSSAVKDKDKKLYDVTEDMLRLQAAGYMAVAEKCLAPQVTAVAACLAQLAGLEKMEQAVEGLQTSARHIDNMLGGDERLAEDTDRILDAADSIFENIGYDPSASAESRLAALRSGREAMKEALKNLAKRPAVWFFGDLDTDHLNAVNDSVPDMVKTVGKVIKEVEKSSSMSGSEIADAIVKELFGKAVSDDTVEAFRTEFTADYSGAATKDEKRLCIATAVVKLMTRQLTNEKLMDKSFRSIMLSGMSDYRMAIEAAKVSAYGEQTNVYKMQTDMDDRLLETIALLERYRSDPAMLTGYYPSRQLLDYVRGLNTAIHAMVFNKDGTPIPDSRVGRYRSLWTYAGSGYDLNVKETTLGEIYTGQMQLDRLLAQGYNNVATRYMLNQLKQVEVMTATVGTLVGALGLSGAGALAAGAVSGVASKLFGTSDFFAAQNQLDEANLFNLAKVTADLAVTTNLMLSKEAHIADDIHSVFETMESWRKVDPELPVELVTADVADVTVDDGSVSGTATAALTVHNAHTGSVTIAPTVEIYDSFGLVNVVSMDSRTVAPGENGAFVVSLEIPTNRMRDMSGYTAVFSFAASEAETMTIAPTFGPYLTHFNVGTEKTLATLRTSAVASQPLGGALAAGESKSATVSVADGSVLTVFAAAQSDETLQLTVEGSGTQETVSQVNENDFVRILKASGAYTLTVTNTGDTALTYDLLVTERPDFGAVAGLDIPHTKVIAGESQSDGESAVMTAQIPLAIYESGLTTDMNAVLTATALSDGAGNSIPAPEFTDYAGNTVGSSLAIRAAEGGSVVLRYAPADGTPDGDYTGSVTVSVTADAFETDVRGAGWVETGDGWALTVPVTVRLDTAVPAAVSIEADAESGGAIAVTGVAQPGASVIVFTAEDETQAGTAAR
ncbi:MAG: carboxypeptidase regulatory-like domain-containing protein, partial [Oscillospiraceae bacterium]|nr:carboxypeptidase regulatory-like domain-containing protein [Oscillospiraceae bacterium]